MSAECSIAREIVSAELDGEADPVESARAGTHLSGCRSCRTWRTSVEALQRSTRVREAESIPDLTESVLARAHPPHAGRGEWIRWALVVVALTQLVVALPDLFADSTGNPSVHESRHVGAMAVALSLGLLYTARIPARAFGMLPLAAALAVTMFVTAVVDVVRGSAPIMGESVHVLELVGFVLVWLLAGSPGLPGRYGRRYGRRYDRRFGGIRRQPGRSKLTIAPPSDEFAA